MRVSSVLTNVKVSYKTLAALQRSHAVNTPLPRFHSNRGESSLKQFAQIQTERHPHSLKNLTATSALPVHKRTLKMGKFGALTSLVRAVFSKQPTTTVQLAVIPELAHIKKGLQKYFNSIPAPTAAPTQSAQPRTAQYTSSTISSHSTFSAGFYSDASSDRSVAVVQTTSQHPETDVSALVLLTLTHGVGMSCMMNIHADLPLTVQQHYSLHLLRRQRSGCTTQVYHTLVSSRPSALVLGG